MRIRHLLLVSSFLLLSGCFQKPADDSAVKIEGGDSQVVTFQTVGDLEDKDHGKQVYFGYGAMNGVGQTKANGVGSLMVFEDGTSAAGLQLNIEMAPEGQFYEAWLAKPGSDAGSWISIGHVRSALGDVRHALKSQQKQDLRDYTLLKVTLEKDDGSPSPSKVVSEGTLKTAKR